MDGFLDLEKRADAEMAASLLDFADEREAAGRPVPDSVWTVAAFHPRPGLVARLIGRLEHPMASMRKTAAVALKNARDSRALSFLNERHKREEDTDVLIAIQDAIDSLSDG